MSTPELVFAIICALAIPVICGVGLHLLCRMAGKTFGCETETGYVPSIVSFAIWFFFTTFWARIGANEAIRVFGTELQGAYQYAAIYIIWATVWVTTLGCGAKRPKNLKAGFASAVCTLMLYVAIVHSSLSVLV